jgi:hypothetical protein
METRTPVFAILAYDGIEAIDIGGTYGVLSMAKRIEPSLSFFVVAKNAGAVVMANGLRLVADHGFAACPTADVLIVLGGHGWERASADAATLEFIREFRRRSRTVAAVCTGGMILAAAGLLTDLTATTKREIVEGESRPLDLLRALPFRPCNRGPNCRRGTDPDRRRRFLVHRYDPTFARALSWACFSRGNCTHPGVSTSMGDERSRAGRCTASC